MHMILTQPLRGDRAGWGYMHDACGSCKQCLRGVDTFCAGRKMYGITDFDQGSLATHAVWTQGFLHHIPDAIDNAHAAPLMCGGATVFSALQMHGVKSIDRVGVVGVGGLGHLAIQYARAFGCDVAVFSGTDSKKDEAIGLGATEFYAMKGKKAGDVDVKPIDHLLVTASQAPDWSIYAPMMAPGGTIHTLTVDFGNVDIPYMTLNLSGLRVQGSLVADRQTHREMLEFSARHGIRPMIEVFPMDVNGIEKAFKTLNDGNMKYRGVLAVQ
jgi:D-arabinose 1-dehydrogenase-like Zn-dependent alcohol dehydrogenase